jgi:hypothetical protein
MYSLRRWSVRHARLLETIYTRCNPLVVGVLRRANRMFGRRIDRPVTVIERAAKSLLFDCKMCGDCQLSRTGMSCPMNCPKTLRNGPCGGVRENGMCEVRPEMACVWTEAWRGAAQMRNSTAIRDVAFAVDHRQIGTSSWLKMARDD